jgi:putative zinc finger protein
MAQMDHNETIQLQAAVKYVLGELSPAQREEYEEHYFDCAECAVDIKALATFADTTRELLRRERETQRVAELAPARGGWLSWLQPLVAVPAMAALLLIIAYQNTVTLPKAREEATSSEAQLFVTSRAPKMIVVRSGEELAKFTVRPNESLPLKFDFTPTPTADAYVCQLKDEAGHTVLQLRVPGRFTDKELELPVPANRVKPGKYTLVFTADPGATGQPTNNEVLRFSFAIEFLS